MLQDILEIFKVPLWGCLIQKTLDLVLLKYGIAVVTWTRDIGASSIFDRKLDIGLDASPAELVLAPFYDEHIVEAFITLAYFAFKRVSVVCHLFLVKFIIKLKL